jgi:iron complex transport system substrate-binding protein
MMMYFRWFSFLLLPIALACAPTDRPAKSTNVPTRSITDMRGQSVRLPVQPRRVITISDGLVETVMSHLGLMDILVGLGSSCVQRIFDYEFPLPDGSSYRYEQGMNPVSLLHPEVRELPLVAHSATAVNMESVAALQPDLILVRIGSCTLPRWDDKTRQVVSRLEAMGFPVVVLFGPPCFDAPDLQRIGEEIRIIGAALGREEQAVALAAYLEACTRLVTDRTRGIRPDSAPDVLLLGLSPKARAGGSAGSTFGPQTMEGYFIDSLVRARHAYRGPGAQSTALLLNTEQLYAIDPDVILLPTASGFHPPEELYTAPYYARLKQLKAVRQKRVYALPWTPCNCARRAEYPIELLIMAKAAYPGLFADIRVHAWALDFYQQVYRTDEETARRIRRAQWLDWMQKEDF